MSDRRDGEPNVGLVVPILNVLAYLLGAVALALPPWVAVTMTVAAVLLLTGREQLHDLARRVEMKEIVTAGEFLILTGIVLPLLPNHPVTTLTDDHAAPGLAGARRGLHVFLCQLSGAALLGGGRRRAVDGGARRALFVDRDDGRAGAAGAKPNPALKRQAQAGITLATAIMYLRILAVVAIFNMRAGARSGAAARGLSLAGFVDLRAAISVRQAGAGNAGARRDAACRRAAIRSNSAPAAIFAALFVAVRSSPPWRRRNSALPASMGSRRSSALPISIRSSSTWRKAASRACRAPRSRPRS